MKRSLFLMLVIVIASCKTQQVSTPVKSTPVVSITAIEWKLSRMADQYLLLVNPSITITLMLDEGKKGISGHGGCNQYFGGYQLSGDAISFTGIGSTKMYCQDKQALEDAYFKALSQIQSYKAEGNNLYLLAADKVMLEFSREVK